MRKPQIMKREPTVKHEDRYCVPHQILFTRLALTQSSQVSRWTCARGQKDGSVTIYKVEYMKYYNATCTFGDQRYA